MSEIIEIKDFSDDNLKFYSDYSEVQLRRYNEPGLGYFVAESPKVVERAIGHGYEPVSFLMEKRHVVGEASGIIGKYPEIPVYVANMDVLSKLTGFQLTRGMLALLKRKECPETEEICKDAKRLVILEDVVNPTNVGAIFRSAAAFHIDAVLLTQACSDPLYRRAARVSMGTVFQIPWTYLSKEESTHLNETMHKLGFKTAAMALCEDSVDIDDENLMSEERLAIYMGTEGDGLKSNTINESDYTVCIPMAHGVDSLNVAAAAAVACWQLGRR